MHFLRYPDGSLVPVDPKSPGAVVVTGVTDTDVALNVATGRVWNSGALTPSASANTFGAVVTMSPSSTQLGISGLLMVRAVFAGTFGSETATVQFASTFSDGSQGLATVTATATGTQVLASGGFITLMKDGLYIKSVAVSLKSTIASSLVTATVDIVAIQN
jgi:hypothetical protein